MNSDGIALVCTVGPHRVAWPLAQVDEVVQIALTAPLPEAPPWVTGLLDVRGARIAVLDVGARIERRRSAPTVDDHVVLCTIAGRRLGLLVRAVLGVQDLRRATEPITVDLPYAAYVEAVLASGSGVVLLLALDRLLATSDVPAPSPA